MVAHNLEKCWRLIPCLQASGAVQMAIDRWLLQQHRQGQLPATLRFYTWSPAAISLGYHQRQWPASWQQLRWQGQPLDLVRRPTGGRAVLHQGDLTYMVVSSGIPGRRLEIYQTICQFLIEGWRTLGVELHYGEAGRGYIHNPHCFGTATGADLITAHEQKLIGSAQLRSGPAILQHGSMRLSPDRELFAQFGETVQGINLPPAKVVAALVEAANRCLGQLTVQPLSETEWQAASQTLEG